MRVCHVLESAGGGSGQVVIDLARAGLALGDEVTLIFSPKRAEASFLDGIASIPGLTLIESPMHNQVGFHDLPDVWRLYKHLRHAGPFDVVHAHSSKAGALVRLVGVAFPNAAKVYTPHCFVTMDSGASRHYAYIERFLSWFCDAIIAVSQFENEHAVARIGINSRKITLIPNGISGNSTSERGLARRVLGYEDDDLVLGFVGRLSSQKNPIRLIQAFEIARELHPSLKLAMIGDGPLRVAIEEETIKRGLSEQIRFFGQISGREVIAAFDALTCSSNYEGFPVVFLEALVAGVPIVTTPIGGARECVIEGQTGFVADNFSAESLALALLRMVTRKPQARQEMSDRARVHASQFGGEGITTLTRSLYQRVRRSRVGFLDDRKEADAVL